MNRLTILALTACLLVLPALFTAETVMLTMRDGTKLHTDVDYFDDKPRTTVIDRSPYGQWGIELLADIWLLFGFHSIRQDFRGTGLSQGNFTLWKHAATDEYDTMEWAQNQSWSNGEFFTIGASADGFASFFATPLSPPWLKGQAIIFASSVGYEVIYPGGAFRYELIEAWLNGTVPNQAAGLIQDVRENEAPGVWWDKLNLTKSGYDAVKWPSVMWAGWYDIFTVGNLIGFEGYQKHASPEYIGKSKLVVDPLGHCQHAHKFFPKNLIEGRALLPALLIYDLYKGKSAAESAKAVTFYVMGANEDGASGNYWTTLDDWPEPETYNLYLGSDGSLSETPVASNTTTDAPASLSYKYDPLNPVPTIGGSNLEIPCGPLDQTPVLDRPDVLRFSTPVLTAPLAVTGAVDAVLYVSSDQVDTDFTVKIMDEYADGTSRLIQDGIVRMRWRNYRSSNEPELMKAGSVYEINLSLWNTSYVWSEGHKLTIAVSSSNFPRFSANPNTGRPLTNPGFPVTATNTIHLSSAAPSRLVLPKVSLSQLPPTIILEDVLATFQRENPGIPIEKAAAVIQRNLDPLMNETPEESWF